MKYCPMCKTSSLDLNAGFITGIYHCTKCGYTGTLIIEQDNDNEKIKVNKKIRKN